jgi:gliding motility-associated lipoprotein GldD
MSKKYFFPIVLCVIISSCAEDYSPKPRGYFRIDFPEKSYQSFEKDCPFTFEYPLYATIVPYKKSDTVTCWNNIAYNQFYAQLHMSYFELTNNLDQHIEDSRTLTYMHTVKADAINPQLFNHPDKQVYGIYYKLKGDAASQIQFHLTDSVNHFIRGGLYFNCTPNNDSLAPVLDFIAEDIMHMMETFEWK